MIRVSVIIPNFDRETLIHETISNVLAQTLPPHEIIVVDDGSTDKSVDVIRSFGAKVKLVQQKNQGPGAARNAGLRVASGDFIQFQDSDDLFSLNKLESQANLLRRDDADIAFSPWVKVKITGSLLAFENQVLQSKMPSDKLSLICWWLRGWSTVFQGLLFRRSFLNRVGFYRTDMMFGEDGELFCRALIEKPRIAFTEEPITLYRLHNLNKLTQDEGLPQPKRVVDWSRCLRYMIEHGEARAVKMDFISRSIFLSGIRKHLRYLRSVPNQPDDLFDFLSTRVEGMPEHWLMAIEWYLRVTEQIRLRLKGSRWMTAYQAQKPSPRQIALIRQLGFTL